MTRPYSILGAVCIAAAYSAIGLLPETLRPLPPTDLLVVLLIPTVIAGIPFAAWLPHWRAGLMGAVWHVPRHALLLPRWVVRLIGTAMIGGALGLLVLAMATDIRYGLMFATQLFITIAFVFSARRRLSRHPSSEFVMPPPFPYPLRRRM